MKKLTMLFLAFTFSLGVIAQNQGMGNGHDNLNNNSSYSITEILLGAILIRRFKFEVQFCILKRTELEINNLMSYVVGY